MDKSVGGMASKGSKVSKSFFITWNNYTEADVKRLSELEGISRIYVGYEVGASGTPHLQGTITWKKAYRIETIRKLLQGAHVETTKDTAMAKNYCAKEGRVAIDIDNRCQGARKDLELTYEYALEGSTLMDFILEEHPTEQQIKHFRTIRMETTPDRAVDPAAIKVIWLYGDTGCGKSRRAYEAGAYRVPTFKWWNMYDRQTAVWIDEMRPGWCKFSEMLELLDIYPYQKEVKGGFVKILATTFYITSPFSPMEMWSTHEDLGQLMRRITDLIEFRMTDLGVVETRHVWSQGVTCNRSSLSNNSGTSAGSTSLPVWDGEL